MPEEEIRWADPTRTSAGGDQAVALRRTAERIPRPVPDLVRKGIAPRGCGHSTTLGCRFVVPRSVLLNRLSHLTVVAAALVAGAVGYSVGGPVGGLIGFGAGISLCGRYLERHRFFRA